MRPRLRRPQRDRPPAPGPLERKRHSPLRRPRDDRRAGGGPRATAAFFDRVHAEAAAEIEAAGGTVEKGSPARCSRRSARARRRRRSRRRAVSAALATRNRLTHEFGETLSLRIGVESGEVILGRPGSFVTGTPVAAAARLVRLAQPGEIVVGERAATATGGAFDLASARSDVPREAGALASHRTSGPAEVRKTVTVLFTDVVESTRLGELDAEPLRRVMSRFFDAMRSVIERHGGIVEKFIGDAVMAVFGVPLVHEDDALRAVRAAAEMRAALATLNDDLDQTWGIRLAGRIGVNTGEVIAGDHRQGHMVVTGTRSNVAAAPRGGRGDGRDPDRRGDLPARARRGRRGPVDGGSREAPIRRVRLVEIAPRVAGRARRFDSPLVGREHELATLLRAPSTTVSGPRLSAADRARLGGRRQVAPRAGVRPASSAARRPSPRPCLPYGEGITY